MTFINRILPLLFVTSLCLSGCDDADRGSQSADNAADSSSARSPETTPTSDAPMATYDGDEKVRPAAGKGNVQGAVLYNGKPAENIEVMLCEEFSRYIGGCSGKSFTARTDKQGVYVITDIDPKVYNGLMARVFETDSYIFATTGIAGVTSATYEVVAGRTLFVPPTNLFKSDLKLVNPKAGSKVSAQGLELKWEAYPEAAYYKFSIYPDEATVISEYVNERVDGTSFTLDKALTKGTYRLQVTAFNGADQKLSESSNDIKFTVTEGTTP